MNTPSSKVVLKTYALRRAVDRGTAARGPRTSRSRWGKTECHVEPLLNLVPRDPTDTGEVDGKVALASCSQTL